MSTSKKKSLVQNNPQAAIEFAKLLGDDWGQHFYALVNGKMVPLFIGGSDILEVSDNHEEIIEWLNEHHELKHNIYYALNPLSQDARGTRADKSKVTHVSWVHVDVDPRKYENMPKIGNAQSKISPEEYLLSEQKRIAELVSNEAALKKKGLPGLPTIDIMSGRGRQVLWKLKTSLELGDSSALVEMAEEYNRGVGRLLDGDRSCWDISRLMRLPGTVNFPDKKKLAQGARPEGALAVLETHRDGARYDMDRFPKEAKDGTEYETSKRSPKAAKADGPKVSKPRVQTKTVFIKDLPEEPEGYDGDLAGLMERWGVAMRTGERILFGGNEMDPREYDSRSENVFGVCRELDRKGVAPKHIMWVITNPDFAISAHVRDPEKNKGHKGMIPYAQRQVTNAMKANREDAEAERERAEAMAGGAGGGGGDDGDGGGCSPTGGGSGDGRDGRRELNRDAPNASAALFNQEEMPHLLFSAQEFLNYDAGRYIGLEEHDVRVSVRRYLVDSLAVRQQGKIMVREPFEPKKLHVSEITAALAETCSKPSVRDERSGALVHSALPVWLTPEAGDPDPKDIMSFPNGLLDLKTGAMLPPTPRFFTRNKRSFDYDSDAPEPTRWLQFLEECWPEQEDTHALIRQMMGYLISSDTSKQVIFTIVGPGGCGKGVFRSVLEGLVGSANTAYPSLSDLAEKFTLESCVSAQMAILSDAHLPEKADDATKAMEALKKISGGDPVHVNRKGIKGMANVKLGMRFVIFANSIPDFKDPGGALAQRMVPIPMRRRFRGTDEQDYDLEAKLEAELPGILNWAIEGLHDLNIKKRFTLGKKSGEELENIKERQSPLFEFKEDYLTVSEEALCSKDDLHELYLAWYAKQEKGRSLSYSKARNVFFRELVPTLDHAINLNYREKVGSPRMVRGVTISPAGLALLQAYRKKEFDKETNQDVRQKGQPMSEQDKIDEWEARYGKGTFTK